MPKRNNLQNKRYYQRTDEFDQFFERRTMYKVLSTEFNAITEFIASHINHVGDYDNCMERLQDIHELTGYYLTTCNLRNRKWLKEYEHQTSTLLWLQSLKH